jgi:hypothetical protein
MTLLKTLPTIGGKEAADAGDQLAADVWDVFNECFADMYQVAIQQHLMERPKFDAMMANQSIEKLVSLDDDGRVVGLTTATTDLTAVPLIDPRFFQRWPDLYEQHRILYVPFIGVLPHAGPGPLMQVSEHIYHWTARVKGAVAFDACNHNNNKRKFTRRLVLAAGLIARDQDDPTPVHETIDCQSYELINLSGAAQ